MPDPTPETIDLHHQGAPRALGAHLIGDVLVDPGPESCVERLLDGLGDRVPRVIALTHIHFDHAGATGALLERWPEVEVWVHARGAKHIVDPTRLVSSARRVFGERFDELWGAVLPVPEDRLTVLDGGEVLGDWRAAYTPGHASHHVIYQHRPSGIVAAGDLVGVRIGEGPVMPPTPAPDIDVDVWHDSLELLTRWEPSRLVLMHFGVFDDVEHHVAAMHEGLDHWARLAAELDEAAFTEAVAAWIRERADDALVGSYEAGMPAAPQYAGLRRYLDRREARAGPGRGLTVRRGRGLPHRLRTLYPDRS